MHVKVWECIWLHTQQQQLWDTIWDWEQRLLFSFHFMTVTDLCVMAARWIWRGGEGGGCNAPAPRKRKEEICNSVPILNSWKTTMCLCLTAHQHVGRNDETEGCSVCGSRWFYLCQKGYLPAGAWLLAKQLKKLSMNFNEISRKCWAKEQMAPFWWWIQERLHFDLPKPRGFDHF